LPGCYNYVHSVNGNLNKISDFTIKPVEEGSVWLHSISF